jgi:hypothetical protein
LGKAGKSCIGKTPLIKFDWQKEWLKSKLGEGNELEGKAF